MLGESLEFNRDMSTLTSFQTGGPARYFYIVSHTEEIAKLLKAVKECHLDIFFIGGGSNLLVSDEGYDGLIAKIAIKGMRYLGDGIVECGAGEQLMDLVRFCADKSLTGIEFATGIWGTVGGAVYGNAGAYGGDIGSIIESMVVCNSNGEIKTVPAEYGQFSYRDSAFKTTKEIVTKINIRLNDGDKAEINRRIEEIMTSRAEKHPEDGKSAGCFFKNIPDSREKFGKLPAGKLLDEIGAKKMSCGDAKVFAKHANIIVNSGRATSKEIRELADILKRKVKERFGLDLEEEIIQIGKVLISERRYL